MEHEQVESEVAHRSAFIYLPISAGAVLVFLLVSNFIGNYSLVAKIGGMVWVAILSLIVSMPIVISKVKRRVRELA